MSNSIRFLVLGAPGGKVREVRISRAGLYAVLLAPIALVLMMGLLVVAWLLSTPGGRQAKQQAPATLALVQPLAPKPASTGTIQLHEGECGAGMILVAGDFCPKVKHKCLRYTDPEGSMLRTLRCAEYETPAHCQAEQRVPMRYCIDRDEYTEQAQSRASNNFTLAQAVAACQSSGKRLCSDEEWTFACEGEAMTPYPYGFARDGTRCNIDRTDLVSESGEPKDLRSGANAFPKCLSPFGVRNMSGNVEEFVLDKNGVGARRGGFWQPGENQCRATRTTGDASYSGPETGFRCCTDAPLP